MATVNQRMINACERMLERKVRTGQRLEYGDVMRRFSIGRHQLAALLDPIYNKMVQSGRADLTLVFHYAGGKFGRYNSRGRRARSVRVNARNSLQVRQYKNDLMKVYTERNVRPSASCLAWILTTP